MHHIFLYIGPGMGGGILSAIIGIFSAFVLSVIAIFWYPLKRLFRFVRGKLDK